MLSSAAMNTYPGILIVFDGIDGSGKTTQVQLLSQALLAVGEDVLVSKEPTDGQWGARLRASAKLGRLPADEELETFIKDRQEHLSLKVIPALEAGKIVIIDRYFYSTIAYQGIRYDDFSELEARVRNNIIAPDVAIFLDVVPELGAFRISCRDGEANHFESLEDLIRIDQIFREIAIHDPSVRMLNGADTIQNVHSEVLSAVASGALKAKRCAKRYGCDDPVMCGLRMNDDCPWWTTVQKLRTNNPEVRLSV